MPNVVSRGRALTSTEVTQYFNSIGTVSYQDCVNLAALLYGMDEGTFKIVLGWDRNENYENVTNVYDGYMCTCCAVNFYAGYGNTTPQSLCDALRGGGPISIYNVPRLQGLADQVAANQQTYQNNLRCTYLALANPNQEVIGFSGWSPGAQYVIYTTVDGGGNTIYATRDPAGTRTYGYSVDGGVIGGGYNVYVDNGYPTKLSEFRAKIFHALACDTDYYNRWPYNLGYWHGAYFSFDCVNLLKAILCGWYDNRTVGYFQADLSRTGDVNEWDFIQECGNVSQNFAALTVTSALYMSGHIGCFVGEYERNGKIYNTIECTAGSIGTGVVSSYVDSNGWRYPDKSKPWTSGRWTLYGDLTPWLVYDVGNIDPGGNISPVNPGGGGVDPPGWQNPQLKKNLPVYMMLRNPRLFGNF